jgi:hypothetical protein
MRAIFTSFDNFMVMFVALFGVFWSTAFMPLLGGPLHTYEARALGVGWESLQSGQAANVAEALEIAASLPAEAVFPSAHAEELPIQSVPAVEPSPLELLGGPDTEPPSADVVATRAAPRPAPRVTRISTAPMIHIEPLPEPACDIAAQKHGSCNRAAPEIAGAST